jgi:hypothetical protein
MSSQLNPIVGETHVVEVAPGDVPELVEVDYGIVLEFQNLSTEFPYFEIQFDGPGPPNRIKPLTGRFGQPIFVEMPDIEQTFSYCMEFKNNDGTCKREVLRFARSCPGCPGNTG